MLLEGFPGPQLCPFLSLTAAQAVNAYLGGHAQPPTPATPALWQPPSSGPGAALPQPGAFPQLLPVGPGPCPGFSARRPPRSSSQRLPGLGLCQGSRSLPESILRPFPLLPHPQIDLAPPQWRRRKAGPGEKEAGAVTGGRRRTAPRPHALYLSGACPPPPRRLRSASVPRALSPCAHAYLAL